MDGLTAVSPVLPHGLHRAWGILPLGAGTSSAQTLLTLPHPHGRGGKETPKLQNLEGMGRGGQWCPRVFQCCLQAGCFSDLSQLHSLNWLM